MKFGKSLSNQVEGSFPEWRDMYISYKELKKRLKMVQPQPSSSSSSSSASGRSCKRMRLSDDGEDGVVMSCEELDFVMLLEAELEKLNWFFEGQEEFYVIRLKDSVAQAKESIDELLKIRKEIVDFHGEMVLLENYSAFNYTGLVKILKKYDKRTGAVMRLPFIQKVLQQPFFNMDLLYKLIKECENLLDHLFPNTIPSVPTTDADGDHLAAKKDGLLNAPKQLAAIGYAESLYMRSALLALRILQEIRSKSSTKSFYSLPPLQSSVLEETWNKVSVLEQVAK